MEKIGIEIQIEPVIKRKPLIKFLSGTSRATCSFKATNIAFRIYNRSNVPLEKVILQGIIIRGMGCDFFIEDVFVKDLQPGKDKTTEAVSVFFSSPGIHWVDIYIKLNSKDDAAYRVIPRQTDLRDKSLKLYSGVRGKPFNLNSNIIPVVDLHSIRLTILTSILAVLTAGLIFLTILLINN